MLNKLFVIITVFALFILTSFADSYAATDATLWIPGDVILRENYHGLIIVDSNTNSDTTFDIITDNAEVIQLITEEVTVPAGKHHGIIQFITAGTGNAKIFAISQDTLLEKSINVVESAATPIKLDLIITTDIVNVLTDENKHTGYVFLLNDFDNPVIAAEPIQVTLTNSGEISLPKNSITIEPGKHYATFKFEAKGTGSLTASAPNLEPDEDSISVNQADEIELHVEIAPEPVPTDSSAEIYFWLERDNRPYLAPHDIKISLSIDKSANLSFDSAIEGAIVLTPDKTAEDRRTDDADARSIVTRTEAQLTRDSKREFIIKEGQYYGRAQVYSSFDTASDITISGLAESINPAVDEETIKESDLLSISTEKSNFEIATQTDVFAYPDPAYDKVEIIVSSRSNNGPVIERLDEVVSVFTDNRLKILPASPSVIKRDQNYVVIEATVVDFDSDVEIFAERNEAESEEITIETSGKYVRGPQLEITPLPVIYNKEQDLFLVSSSHDKIATVADQDPKSSLISITSRPSFPFEAVRDSESVIVVRGTIYESLEEEPIIHVASNAETATESLEVYNPERKTIDVQHPPKAFPHEPFPMITHTNDLNNNIVKKSSLKISSIANLTAMGELVYVNQTGKHDVIFYDKNSVPVKSTITIEGASQTIQAAQAAETASPVIFTYEVIVKNGEGSGTYQDGQEITISAPAVIDDMFIIKKKLVGWKDLPYTEPSVTFEVDDNIETAPIYQDDYTIILGIAGSAGAVGGIVGFKKLKKKDDKDETTDEDQILEDLLK